MNMLKIMVHAGVLRHSTAINCNFESQFKFGLDIPKAFEMDVIQGLVLPQLRSIKEQVKVVLGAGQRTAVVSISTLARSSMSAEPSTMAMAG